jgi:hypothetical protein
MARSFVGYEKIIRTFGLPARPHRISSRIDTSAKSRSTEQEKDRTLQIFDPRYDKGDKLESQLAFAFRYEGINLEILAFLFRKTGEEEIAAWLKREPRGKYARMAGFLYEFLTGKNLHVPDTPPVQSVKVLDPQEYVTGTSVKNRRFHVENNLLGSPEFCPVIRLNQTTGRAPEGHLKSELHELMKRVDSRQQRKRRETQVGQAPKGGLVAPDRAHGIHPGSHMRYRFGPVGPIPPDHAASGSQEGDCGGGSFDPRDQFILSDRKPYADLSGLSGEAGKESRHPTLRETAGTTGTKSRP